MTCGKALTCGCVNYEQKSFHYSLKTGWEASPVTREKFAEWLWKWFTQLIVPSEAWKKPQRVSVDVETRNWAVWGTLQVQNARQNIARCRSLKKSKVSRFNRDNEKYLHEISIIGWASEKRGAKMADKIGKIAEKLFIPWMLWEKRSFIISRWIEILLLKFCCWWARIHYSVKNKAFVGSQLNWTFVKCLVKMEWN